MPSGWCCCSVFCSCFQRLCTDSIHTRRKDLSRCDAAFTCTLSPWRPLPRSIASSFPQVSWRLISLTKWADKSHDRHFPSYMATLVSFLVYKDTKHLGSILFLAALFLGLLPLTSLWVCICVRIFLWCVYICLCMSADMYVYMYLWVHVYVYVYVYVFVCVHVCVCVCVFLEGEEETDLKTASMKKKKMEMFVVTDSGFCI